MKRRLNLRLTELERKDAERGNCTNVHVYDTSASKKGCQILIADLIGLAVDFLKFKYISKICGMVENISYS